MKLLLLTMGSLFATTCFSQIKHDKRFNPGIDLLNKNRNLQSSIKPANKLSLIFPQAKRIDSTEMGTVYALPQDNMRCVVPDMNQFQSMPNVGVTLYTRKPTPHKDIPNPYPTLPLIPKKKNDSK